MSKRIGGVLLIIVLSAALSMLTANLLVTVFGLRFSFGLSTPLGDIESILAYSLIGASTLPHLFVAAFLATTSKNAVGLSVAPKSEGVE